MATVAILVSTYNGEKFLSEQLDSLLAQSGVEAEIFVRDDGSSDGTAEILKGYEKRCSNFHAEFGRNLGVGNSFMNLLYSVPDTFDYYAFSDQDDIWDKEKISEAIKLIVERGALLYASNQKCTDKDGNTQELRYDVARHIHTAPAEIISRNMVSGCTMVFPNRFFKLLTAEDKRPSEALLKNRIHDVWLAMVASLYDGIVYDERAFIRYRQHENNVVGAYEGGRKRKSKERKKKLRNSELRNGRSRLAQEVCGRFPDKADKYPIIGICSRAKSFGGKMKILKNGKQLRSYTGEGRLGFFVKVMLGLF